jgi:beta-glucosidase
MMSICYMRELPGLIREGRVDASLVDEAVLLGPVARSHDVLGSWSAQGVPAEAVSLADGLQEAARRHDIDLEVARYGQKPEDYTKLDDATFQEAVALARRADVVVLALGEPSAMSGEASSRTDIRLPQAQVELFDAVRAVNPHVVVVLSNGRPLDLGQIVGAQAILESWFLGTESGAALADILCGDTNPSGRLSMSFPESVGQVPVYYNGDTTGRPYEVAPQEKYVSKYLDAGNYARYPFGFGLSYSHFVYGEPELTSTTFDAEHPLEIAVDVTNDSDADGVDVVQLYVRDPVAAVVRPVRELKGFHRVAIAAHETVTVRFTLCERDVRYVHPDLAERSDPGDFLVSVGPNSRDLNSPMTVRLTETAA